MRLLSWDLAIEGPAQRDVNETGMGDRYENRLWISRRWKRGWGARERDESVKGQDSEGGEKMRNLKRGLQAL